MCWEEVFVGREHELEALEAAWEEAQEGRPQCVVLLGETGLGKTRIVQELYGRLSRADGADPDGYWPDTLEVGRSLSINPDPEAVNLKAQIPWLWWGMRFEDPTGRNLSAIRRSPFEAEDPALRIHGERIAARRDIENARRDQAKTLLTMFAEWGAEVLTLGALGLVTDLMEIWDREQEVQEAQGQEELEAAELVRERTRELAERAVGTLGAFLDAKVKDTPTIPVVLVLDDAQWADVATARTVHLQLKAASERSWPLFVLATHWQGEWETAEVDGTMRTLRDALEKWRDAGGALKVLPLKTLGAELAAVVKVALPGLDDEQRDRLLAEADGNPRALEEMIRILLRRPEIHFKDGTRASALTENGVARLAALENTDLFQKVKMRFEKFTSLEVQETLSTASMFGLRFLRPLVEEILTAVDEDWDDEAVPASLSEAERIYAMVQRWGSLSHEFQQRLYQQVAEGFLDQYPSRRSSREEALDKRMGKWLERAETEELSEEERMGFFAFALDRYLEDPERHAEWAGQAGRAASRLVQERGGVDLWRRLHEQLERLSAGFLAAAARAAWTLPNLGRHSAEDRDRAGSLLEEMRRASEDDPWQQACVLVALGDVSVQGARWGEAKDFYEDSLRLSRQLIEEQGETAESLFAACVSLNKIGDVEIEEGRPEEARQSHEEALEFFLRWRTVVCADE